MVDRALPSCIREKHALYTCFSVCKNLRMDFVFKNIEVVKKMLKNGKVGVLKQHFISIYLYLSLYPSIEIF